MQGGGVNGVKGIGRLVDAGHAAIGVQGAQGQDGDVIPDEPDAIEVGGVPAAQLRPVFEGVGLKQLAGRLGGFVVVTNRFYGTGLLNNGEFPAPSVSKFMAMVWSGFQLRLCAST